jgi:hypothetical protein
VPARGVVAESWLPGRRMPNEQTLLELRQRVFRGSAMRGMVGRQWAAPRGPAGLHHMADKVISKKGGSRRPYVAMTVCCACTATFGCVTRHEPRRQTAKPPSVDYISNQLTARASTSAQAMATKDPITNPRDASSPFCSCATSFDLSFVSSFVCIHMRASSGEGRW